MTDFGQANSSAISIYGWRCSDCDFDLCFRCVKADIFINEVLINREDWNNKLCFNKFETNKTVFNFLM